MTVHEFNDQLVKSEPGLKRFAYKLTSIIDEAKDLVQETILKALMNRDKYLYDVNFKAWTYTIMRNIFINNYRQNISRKTLGTQTDDSFNINQAIRIDSVDPLSVYAAREIKRNIENLRIDYRESFQFYLQGFSYKEIASKLNLNIGTVKSRIFLAKKELMSLINN